MKQSQIEDLDPNFKKIDPKTGLHWYDIRVFGIEGQGWPDTKRPPMPDFQQKQRILYASQCGNWHNIQLAFVLGL